MTINPFDYLIELQKHAEELAKNPADWMPWNYRQDPATGRHKSASRLNPFEVE